MLDDLMRKTKGALVWNSLNQVGVMGSRILITVILARLLLPEDFGLIAMIMAVISFSDILINSGFSQGIIQKKVLGTTELSSVFFLNICIGLLCCLTIYFTAPLLAMFFENEKLTNITRVLALTYLFRSFTIVQLGLMSREMDFKTRTISMFVAQIIAGILAIIAAYYGFGVWSLVINIMLNDFLKAIIFWIQSKWKPILIFKINSIKELWSFSSKLLYLNFIAQIGNKVDIFIVGKYFSPDVLGFYSKGKEFAILPGSLSTQIISSSFFPVFSKIQDDKELFYSQYIRVLSLIIMIFLPVFSVMFVCSESIVNILLGVKWLDSVPFFQWSTVLGFFAVSNLFMYNVLNAKGRSDLNLNKTLVLAPLRILSFIAIPIIFNTLEPLYFIYVYILFFFVEYIIYTYFISKITETRFFQNVTVGVEFIALTAIVVSIAIFLFNFVGLPENPWIDILLTSLIMTLPYVAVLFFSKNTTFFWCLKKLKIVKQKI